MTEKYVYQKEEADQKISYDPLIKPLLLTYSTISKKIFFCCDDPAA